MSQGSAASERTSTRASVSVGECPTSTPSLRVVGRAHLTHLARRQPEQVEDGVEPAGGDRGVGGLAQLLLRTKGDAEPRLLEHEDVVGAVADGDDLIEEEALGLRDRIEQLGL